MTPEKIEKHRIRFEELIRLDKSWLMRNGKGEYFDTEVRWQFKGYIMHAETREVELPPRKCVDHPEAADDWDDGYNYCHDEFKIYLESQGYKTKSSEGT